MKCKKRKEIKKICHVCKKEFYAKTDKSKFCSLKCKSQGYRDSHPELAKPKKKCKMCNAVISSRSKFCSTECRNLFKLLNDIEKSKCHKDDPDYVKCKICGFFAKDLTKHIAYQHCPVQEYHEIFENADIRGKKYKKKQSNRLKGKNNPGYNHGGKFSPFSDKFIGKISKKDAIAKATKSRKENPEKQNTNVLYYLEEAHGNMELADHLLRERQAVGRKENFIKRYGEKEGLRRWEDRQEKWLKSMPKTNFSMVSQKLFWSIADIIGIEDVYFAELSNGVADFSGKNNELTVKHLEGWCKPDFIKGNKIIEFDGAYWHSGHVSKKRDDKKEQNLIKAGYEVLRIKEKKYYNDEKGVLKECINFLQQ